MKLSIIAAMLIASLLLASAGLAAEPNVLMQPGGAMYLNGEPFMPIGAWCHSDIKFSDLNAWNMNTAFIGLSREDPEEGARAFGARLSEATDVGLKVIGYFGYGGWGEEKKPPGWTEQEMRPYLAYKDHPALIGWCLGDDLLVERHLEGVKQAHEIIKRIDPVHPTMGDSNGRAIDDFLPFKPYLDITLPYTYPVAGSYPDWYETYMTKRRAYMGDPVWTFLQAFNTKGTWQGFGVGGWGRGPTPDPGQFRIIAYLPVALGYKGLIWFGAHTLVNNPERAHQVSILDAELEQIGPLAVTMQPSDSADTFATYRSHSVKTYCLENDKRKLVFVLSWRKNDFHTLGSTGYENFPVRIKMRGDYDLTLPTGPSIEAYQVGFPGLRKMKITTANRSAIDMHIRRLEVMGVYLITEAGDPLIEQWQTAFSEQLVDISYNMTALAELQIGKVKGIHDKLVELGVEVPEPAEALTAAEQAHARAVKARQDLDYEFAYKQGAEALVHCRALQTAYMRHAWNMAAKYGTLFYALPTMFEKLKEEARNPEPEAEAEE